MNKLRIFLLSFPRSFKVSLAAATDFVSLSFAVYLALLSSEVSLISLSAGEIISISFFPFISVFLFYLFGLYKSVVRYIDFSFFLILLRILSIVSFLNFIIWFALNLIFSLNLDTIFVPRISLQGWTIGLFLIIFLIFSSRIFMTLLLSRRDIYKKVVIYGAGSAGIQLASALRVSKEFEPIAFVDKDKSLQGSFLGELKILEPTKLRKFIKKRSVDEVLIAMPSASKLILRNLLKEIEDYSVKVRILPGLAELASGKISVSELKEVEVSDLLGRNEVAPNKKLLNKNIKDKVVLITGAGGSIGSEISRQVKKNNPKKIVLLDSNEFSLYSIKNELSAILPSDNVFSVLANITNKERISEVCKAFQVNTIYHAAAYKHVPLVEENPFEALHNNIMGTKICVECAIQANVETFVLISTDKAVRPTNIMGATKRFAELVLQSIENKGKTSISIVRFGNVIGSSGSAIPLFQEQIRKGGPVTVTDPEVVRYFMTIPEAAQLVIQAGALGKDGDVFVLDMGEPVKILELAKRLINLSGMEFIDKNNPDGDIEIKFTGLRPGEKLYEELLIGDDVSATEHQRILKAKEDSLTEEVLSKYLVSLSEADRVGDVIALREIFKEAITGFEPEEDIVDIIYTQMKD